MIKTRIHQISRFSLFILLICSIIFSVPHLNHQSSMVTAEAAESTLDWNTTLIMSGSDGTGFTLEFGESANASDDVDTYDMPIPPSPPVIPHINARFLTSFDPPNAELYKEVKSYPDTNKTWNFSVIWFAGPGNTSSITITIQWKNSELQQSEYENIHLLKNNTVVMDMLDSNQYSFPAANNEPSFFSIVCSNGELIDQNGDDNPDDSSDTPFLPFVAMLLSIFVVILYKKPNNKK